MPRIPSPFGPIRVGKGLLTCAECGAEPGDCEHTKEKPYRVLLLGDPDLVYVAEPTPLFEMGPVTPCPMRMPRTVIEEVMDAHRDIPFTPIEQVIEEGSKSNDEMWAGVAEHAAKVAKMDEDKG